MSRKFLYLTKVSLKKKTNSKWFLITNIILALTIILLLNINSVITFFGGDFDSKTNILVIDNDTNTYQLLESNIAAISNSLDSEVNLQITKIDETEEDAKESLKDEDILIVLNSDTENYLKATIISNEKIDTITYQVLSQSLTSTKSTTGMIVNEIDLNLLSQITSPIEIERVVLTTDKSVDENMELIMSSVFPVLILPFFMLVVFLIQMIGSEISEEKTTRSMEIIISNVSPKTHLLSKVLASNIFVILQGLLLIIYAGIGLLISTNFGKTDLSLPTEITSIFDSLVQNGFLDKIIYLIPLVLILIILSFIAYSLVAGILASMTVNMEDFSQLQTPIVLTSLMGYYLSMMAGMFEGSIFIRVISYIPFLSSFVSPTLYIMGQVSIVDILISIAILILFIYIILKYGLRAYKVGILNYSNEKVWSKFIKAFKTKDI